MTNNNSAYFVNNRQKEKDNDNVLSAVHHSNSAYISMKQYQMTQKTGLCYCDVCVYQRTSRQLTGKPVTKSLLDETQEIDRRAQINKQKIKIINNMYAVCQGCGAHVRLLPETQTLSENNGLRPENIQRLKDKLAASERGEIKLNSRQISGLKKSIATREKMRIEKQSMSKRIPLYKCGELWVCGQCFVCPGK
jgi:hypothetical protein